MERGHDAGRQVKLNAYVAGRKRAIFDALFAGQPPNEGAWDEAIWRDGRAKGDPQMGSTRYLPNQIILEFIYNDPQGAAVILPVTLESPERIVFLPVPTWVVESIWQGEIDGTYQFESDALEMVEQFRLSLDVGPNELLFGPQMAKRRE